MLRLSICSSGLLLALSCGGARSECHADTWSGSCALLSVVKTRDIELPLPSVELEAIYQPQIKVGSNATPADARRQFTVLSKYEDALREHLQAQTPVRCYLNPPAPGQCQPGAMVVEVAEFDASRVTVAADTGPKGCAQIEAASSQDSVARTTTGDTAHNITQRFQFEEGSAALPPDADELADAIAARMKQTPELQCVGVVGQWVRGENAAVAFARAQAVRELLTARGIEPERLVSLTVDAPMVGLSGMPEPPKPGERRVSISVLLDITAPESGKSQR